MRNYVIINGVNSLTIKGLAINELPPISKPPMRVLQEEIDGRDGDLITELGYGAYDKVMTIGLYHTFDIDQIIAFFNGSGTIVFSNEPDKKYNFKIIEQIDYESLIKFKTASITLHCQPFKYPLTETPIETAYDYITETGTNITLNNTKSAPMQLTYKGNTQQDSTTGKNLFNINKTSFPKTTTSFTATISDDGIVHITGTKTTTTWENVYLSPVSYITLENGITYAVAQGMSLQTYKSNGGAWVGNLSGIITPSEDYEVRGAFWTTNQSGTIDVYVYPQIEKGSTQTSYEPYTNGASPNPDYPQDIHVVSGDNTIEICGKNLFDGEYEVGYININTGANESGSNVRTKNYIRVMPNTQYAISNNVSHDTWACYYDRNKTFISNQKLKSGTSGTFTTPNDNNIYYVRWYDAASTGDSPKWQLEKGNQATTYEAYTGQSQLISLGDIELCKIGDYQDSIFYNTTDTNLDLNSWYIKKEIGSVVLDGDENFSTNNSWNYTNTNAYIYALNNTNTNLLSNHFKYNSNAYNVDISGAMGIVWSNMLLLRIDKTLASDTTAFKTWLSTHNTEVKYPLATPTYTKITDTTLLGQLEAIKYSYENQTNVSQDNNDLPFELTITAETLDSGVATINNIGNIYSKPTIDIEGNGTVNVSLNGNQIFSVNVDEEVIIDSTNLEAYKPDGTLQNRQVTGNIGNLKLNTGTNTMTFSGDLDKATITDYVRYL